MSRIIKLSIDFEIPSNIDNNKGKHMLYNKICKAIELAEGTIVETGGPYIEDMTKQYKEYYNHLKGSG